MADGVAEAPTGVARALALLPSSSLIQVIPSSLERQKRRATAFV